MVSDSKYPASSTAPTEKELKQIYAVLDKTGFASKFAQHTERGAALSAVAMLDAALSAALQAWMVNDEDVIQPMFHEGQPLGAFGSKIRLAYLLGMYSKVIYNDLNTVGKIRNAFAHKEDANDFDNPQIRSWTQNLSIAAHLEKKELEMTGQVGKEIDWQGTLGPVDKTKPRWMFILSVMLLTSLIKTIKSEPHSVNSPIV